MNDTHTLLLVEDDDATRTFLADNLSADGYEVLLADGPDDALARTARAYPDVAVVDLNGGSGRAFARAVRAGAAGHDALPIVLLSADADELERLRAFDAGADDLVLKPFSYPELRARIAALLRRAQMRERGRAVARVGNLHLHAARREVRVRGQLVELSAKEYALLQALIADPTRVITKQELLRAVWGYRAHGSTRTLDSHACRLRHKLGAHGDRFVINVWGVGYCLVQGVGVRDGAA